MLELMFTQGSPIHRNKRHSLWLCIFSIIIIKHGYEYRSQDKNQAFNSNKFFTIYLETDIIILLWLFSFHGSQIYGNI